jgi:hypothetical protein
MNDESNTATATNTFPPAHAHTSTVYRHTDAMRRTSTDVACVQCGLDMSATAYSRAVKGQMHRTSSHDVAVVDGTYRVFSAVRERVQ